MRIALFCEDPNALHSMESFTAVLCPFALALAQVAMNMQRPGKVMVRHIGKFLENGGCGYVLKPKPMRSSAPSVYHFNDYTVTSIPATLIVEVMIEF